MEKPILATNIDGFLIDHSAFIEPHRVWFDRIILMTKDPSFNKWKGHANYFKGVNLAMQKVMPNATKQEQTAKAREWYQEDVIYYIEQHPEIVNYKLAEILKKLKSKFTLALITTNTKEHINKILKAAKLKGIYNIIHASSSNKEPNKSEIAQEFKSEYKEPKYYIASRSKEAFETFPKIGTLCIYFTLDKIDPKLQNLASKTITNPQELELLNGT